VWQVVSAHATGTSHAATGAPCQDREGFRIVDDADGGQAVVAVICDGAGSAVLSDAGADLTCEALRTLAGAFVADHGASCVTEAQVYTWVADIQARIVQRAKAEKAQPRDYACTLVFVIAADSQTICGQIGDGAIVLNTDEELTVALWPQNGEYANQTFFVSQDDARDHLQLARFGAVRDFVVFSDGLQRLALNEALRIPHAGFFRPLIETVRTAEVLDGTRDDLEAFLSSERVNSKTDDDKSIVIACRVD
jgi:hypothetical protein